MRTKAVVAGLMLAAAGVAWVLSVPIKSGAG
jgi:hypothetical protein